MGLFDKLGGETKVELSPKAAMLLAAITMVAADGDTDDDEISIISRMDRKQDGAFDQAAKVWKMSEFKECMELATEAMNADQKVTTLANLVDIAMADGTLEGNEKKLLEAYVKLFGVPEATVSQIVEVMAIKNNEAVFDKS
jgi:uncharacterized tellurite resistance protein B-like protein